MLLNLKEYHRPGAELGTGELDAALTLLARKEVNTVPLGGGDYVLGNASSEIEAVVDLQGLHLDQVTVDVKARSLCLGAMLTRAELAGCGEVLKMWNGVLAEGAKRWGGSLQRNRATLGGAIATAASEDPLLAVLLACDAVIVLYGNAGYFEIPLAEFLSKRQAILGRPALIVEVRVEEPDGIHGGALASVARTPADISIVVAAAAVILSGDRCTGARLALGGVAEFPVRVPEVEGMVHNQALAADLLEDVAAQVPGLVRPSDDYRGSAEYRSAMAGVLSARALREAWARAVASD